MILLLASTNMMAQSQNVTGKVIDQDGYEVIGATVIIKGQPGVGTVTNIDGVYTLQVEDAANDVLVISFIGMDTKEIPVKGQTTINVTMTSNAIQLNEVVAIGYGTVKRKDLTGAVSSVRASDIEQIPVANISQALGGKIAGVQVTTAQGSPDAAVSIKVRGGGSITQSNEPLYIIDGFITDDGLLGIDPTSIESIDVLKDASATAIYGARGANGVVVVTTKSGEKGRATINYDMYYGFKKINKRLDVLNPYDFVNLEYERAVLNNTMDAFETMYGSYTDISKNYLNRSGINWQDEVFDEASPTSMMHKISISGGGKSNQYNVSYTHNNDDGIMLNSGLKRNSLRFKFSQEINDRISFSTVTSWTDESTTGLGSLNDGGRFSRMAHIWQYRPTIGINGDDRDLVTNDEDPALVDDSGNQMQNPIASIEGEHRKKRNKILQMNADLTVKIIDGLTYKGTIGIRNRNYRLDEFHTMRSRTAKNKGGAFGSRDIIEYNSLIYNNVLTFDKQITPDHHLNMMIGQEDAIYKDNLTSLSASNFPDDHFELDDMSLGVPGKNLTERSYKRVFSYFGRVNYNLMEKYLVSLSVRRDGSTVFGVDNKWGTFPSASVAWRAIEEDFIKNLKVFSNLKVRLSYGTAGNDRIPSGLSLSRMISDWIPMGNVSSPIYSGTMANPNLKWETSVQSNIGLDMSFFNHRLQATVDFYNNDSQDLLLNRKLAFISGYENVMMNIGKTRNRGVEVSLTSFNIQNKDFTWTTTLNLSTNDKKVVQLAGKPFFEQRTGWNGDFNDTDYLIEEGSPLGQMYGYVYDGIYTVDQFDYDAATEKYTLKADEVGISDIDVQPGHYKYKKVADDGNKDITTADKTVIGKANPKLFGGLTNNFTYKGFDLSIFLNFSYGNDVYNANRMFSDNLVPKYRNSMTSANDRFTFIDANGNNLMNNPTALAALNQGKTVASVQGVGTNMRFHSLYVEDGSFLRINNITLGYTLPKKILSKAYIKNLRLYGSVYNLHTFTNYSGYDPEVDTNPNSGLTPGVDWGAYPRALSFVFGANITF